MGKNFFLLSNESKAFGHALNLINESLDNLKDVFNNVIPEVLARYGLKQSLTELCESVKKEHALSAEFIYEGSEKRINTEYEQFIYGIAFELIDNALRHADATYITVQIHQRVDQLVLIVKDNGKGFDPVQSEAGKDRSLTKIRTQLRTYHGWMAISSKPGKGSEVMVEFNW